MRATTVPLPFLGLRAGYTRLRESRAADLPFCGGGGTPQCTVESAAETATLHLLEATAFLTFKTSRKTWFELGGGVAEHWATAEAESRESGRRSTVDAVARPGWLVRMGLSRGGLLGTPLLGTLSYAYRRADLNGAVEGGRRPLPGRLEVHQVEVALSYSW